MIGRDHYAEIYASQLDAQAKWLAFGAVAKADSVEELMHGRPRPNVLLELGAGTGAVIAELQRRSFADRYIAIDYSVDACRYMQKHLVDVDIRRADIVLDGLAEKVNIVVLSHVLEHLEDPERLLRSIASDIDFDWLIIECPLDDLPAARVKNLFRDRRKNLAGHVQFYNLESFCSLVSKHFDVIARRHYAPVLPREVVTFVSRKDRVSWAKHVVRQLTMNLCPRTISMIWKHVWHAHCALLCRRYHHE
jgi:SAM-dependent methyltransferase